MQTKHPQSTWSFIDPAHAALPRPLHWLLNTMAVIGLAAPYLTVLAPWFAAVWGANQLQSFFGMAVWGTLNALMTMIKTAATICAIDMLFTMYCIRHEYADEVRRSIYEACEEFFYPWLR